MGMFDYFCSSYNLGAEFTNTVCQTKDIEEGIGGTMTHYWLDPNGVLWYPDYTGTNIIKDIPENDPRYNPKFKWINFEWVRTGVRGKLQHHPITKYIEIYRSEWDGEWEDWPRLRLHFKRGILIEFDTVHR